MSCLICKIKDYDVAILKFINKKMKCSTLDILMPILTYLGSATFGVFFSTLMLINSNELGFKLLYALVINNTFVIIIKLTTKRVRPYCIYDLYVRKIDVDKYSFPSAHTSIAFSIWITLILSVPGMIICFIIVPIIVGFSRIYIGVHYPTDVFMGMFIGIISSVIAVTFFKQLFFVTRNMLC